MIKPLLFAATAALALTACNKAAPEVTNTTNVTAAEPAAPAEMPPAIVAQTTYRCKDQSLVYLTYLAGDTQAQLREIAEKKMKDLNANDIDAAAKIIEGSARAMGLEVVEG